MIREKQYNGYSILLKESEKQEDKGTENKNISANLLFIRETMSQFIIIIIYYGNRGKCEKQNDMSKSQNSWDICSQNLIAWQRTVDTFIQQK